MQKKMQKKNKMKRKKNLKSLPQPPVCTWTHVGGTHCPRKFHKNSCSLASESDNDQQSGILAEVVCQRGGGTKTIRLQSQTDGQHFPNGRTWRQPKRRQPEHVFCVLNHGRRATGPTYRKGCTRTEARTKRTTARTPKKPPKAIAWSEPCCILKDPDLI